jgi:hypothetical protein
MRTTEYIRCDDDGSVAIIVEVAPFVYVNKAFIHPGKLVVGAVEAPLRWCGAGAAQAQYLCCPCAEISPPPCHELPEGILALEYLMRGGTITVGPIVWLNGALLWQTTAKGVGIVGKQRPRYAKLKWCGTPLAVPQPAPLSHTIWPDVSYVQTVNDLTPVNYRDDSS